MSAITGQIAAAVAGEINDTDFGVSFTAKRKWLAKWQLAQLASLRVSVVPGPVTFDSLDRRRDDQRYDVDVIIQKKLSASLADGSETAANSEIDALVELMEGMAGHFRNKQLEAGSIPMICAARRFVAPGDSSIEAELLRDPRIFSGVIRLNWRRLH